MESKYVTLVFRNETKEEKALARKTAHSKECIAWSLDHEILRADLMRDALEKNDIDRAKMYADELDVSRFRGDLN